MVSNSNGASKRLVGDFSFKDFKDLFTAETLKRLPIGTMVISNLLEIYMTKQDTFVEDIVAQYCKNYLFLHESGSIVNKISDWEYAKNHVMPRVCNFNRNKENISGLITSKQLDLLTTYELVFPAEDGKNIISRIGEYHLERFFGITEEELKEAAEQNLKKNFATQNLGNMINKLLLPNEIPDFPDTPLFLALPAAALTSKELLDHCSETAGNENIYIFPSSIHEFLYMTESDAEEGHSPKEFISFARNMIAEVNETLHEEEYLSDNLYFYNAKTRELTIA